VKKVVLLISILVLIIACSPKQDVPEIVVEPTGEVVEISMEAKKFEFIPSTIEVNQGDTVRITAVSTDVDHGLAIDEYGIREKLLPNEPATFEFVADKTGEFIYYCSVFCGKGHGKMRGKLIVR